MDFAQFTPTPFSLRNYMWGFGMDHLSASTDLAPYGLVC